MIYQDMYGYLTIEDPEEQKKVWPLLSPQVRDYVNVFLSLMKQAPENIYYQKSKFYRLISEEEFENLCLVYLAMQSKDVVIDLEFEAEFKQAFVAYEKKSAMKAKMNRWRSEMIVEHEKMAEPRQQVSIPSNSEKSSKFSFGCLIEVLIGLLILLAIYFGRK